MNKYLPAIFGAIAFTAAGPATAADPWTGWYAGANLGYSWGKSDTATAFYHNTTGVLLASGSSSFDLNGVIGGGQIGYNWLSGQWVFGIEADIQASGQDGRTSFACPAVTCSTITGGPGFGVPTTLSLNQSIDWFATVRGRIGSTLTPTTVVYVTGGLAFAEITTDGTLSGYTAGGVLVNTGFSFGETNAGWTIGAGMECIISDNWRGKVEYLYMDLGSVSGTVASPTLSVPVRATFNSDISDHILRVGINYRFPPR